MLKILGFMISTGHRTGKSNTIDPEAFMPVRSFFMNFAFKGMVTAAVFAGFVSSSFAWSNLNPGNFTLLDNSGPDFPSSLGTVIANKTTSIVGKDNNNNIVFTGFATSYVVQYDGAGDLAFGFFVQNDASSHDAIERVTVTDFAGFSTVVANGDNTFVAPTVPHAYFATRSGNGSILGFNWVVGLGDGDITQGNEGRFVWIETDAKAYKDGQLSAIDGGVGTTDTYAPAAVPEPATMAVLGVGAVAMIRRRRKQS